MKEKTMHARSAENMFEKLKREAENKRKRGEVEELKRGRGETALALTLRMLACLAENLIVRD